jgi:hypothetical protein
MRTDIEKSYQWGFVLSEQDLRRIVQTCHEHAEKLGGTARQQVTAKLRDGSVVEGRSVDDVLSLENGGQKALTRLDISYDDGSDPPKSLVSVTYQDGFLNPKNWQSIVTRIVGESRDAVFVAAADLDERIKKTRSRAWPYLTTRPWFLFVPLIFAMLLVSILSDFTSPQAAALNALEAEFRAGRLSNPIEAMIFFERAKAQRSLIQSALLPAIVFGLPLGVFGLVQWVLSKWSLSYVFYWGDAIALFDKRKNMVRGFWTIVVLGIVVSIIAGLIVEYFKSVPR